MKPYADYTRSERCAEYAALQEQYDAWKAKKLSLNMARGKPSRTQLDMVSGILTVLQSPEDCFDGALDVRNYGELTGIPSAQAPVCRAAGRDALAGPRRRQCQPEPHV